LTGKANSRDKRGEKFRNEMTTERVSGNLQNSLRLSALDHASIQSKFGYWIKIHFEYFIVHLKNGLLK